LPARRAVEFVLHGVTGTGERIRRDRLPQRRFLRESDHCR
jgi:hypothetical protein